MRVTAEHEDVPNLYFRSLPDIGAAGWHTMIWLPAVLDGV